MRFPASVSLTAILAGLALMVVTVSGPPAPADAPAAKAPARKLLIVAPLRFHKALAAFVAHKRRSLPTELVSLETALKGPGADHPERLKRYLYDAWRRRHVGYVLLVGDVDVMPVRYMVLDRATPAAFDYAFYPSDLYYSDLARQDGSFDDWNARKDGFHARYFGEVRGEKNKKDPINFDRIDDRPDVAVGRWPVSTPAEVELLAEKTIAYEQGLAGRKPGAHRLGLFAVGGWVDTRPLMDRIAGRMSRKWSVDKRYYASKATPPPNEKQLLALLNEGAGLVCHTGHGSENTWERCFSVGSLARLKNADRLPVLVSAGCSTAYFAPLAPYDAYVDADGKEHKGTTAGEVFRAPPPPPAPYQRGRYNPTGLGEQLLRKGKNGAVAYIGCNTGSQPCALTLLDGFMLAVARNPQPRLGDCWAQAVAHYYDKEGLARLRPNNDWYPPSIFFQGMKFMLFGDPSLPLPPSA